MAVVGLVEGSTDEVVVVVVETEEVEGEDRGVGHLLQQRRVMQRNQQRLPETWKIGLDSPCSLTAAGILKYG